MTKIARHLNGQGYTLRSGGAVGADTAFEQGAGDNKEIFKTNDATPEAIEIAMGIHPAPNACKPYVKKLHGRNVQIILGYYLDTPVEFVVCWTYKGNQQGGSALGMRLAGGLDIPVYNRKI